MGVAGLRSSGPAAGPRPFLARARGCRCPDAARRAVAAAGLAPRVPGRCGPESGAKLWVGPRGLGGRGRLVSVSVLRGLLSCCRLMSPHAVVSVSPCCLSVLSPHVLLGCHLWRWWAGAKGTLGSWGGLAVHVIGLSPMMVARREGYEKLFFHVSGPGWKALGCWRGCHLSLSLACHLTLADLDGETMRSRPLSPVGRVSVEALHGRRGCLLWMSWLEGLGKSGRLSPFVGG